MLLRQLISTTPASLLLGWHVCELCKLQPYLPDWALLTIIFAAVGVLVLSLRDIYRQERHRQVLLQIVALLQRQHGLKAERINNLVR